MRYPKLAIFDCDGVLTDTANLHFRAWSEVTKKWFNIVLTDSYVDKLRGLSRDQSVEIILQGSNQIILNQQEHQQFITEKNDLYVNLLKTKGNVKLFQPTVDLIYQLRTLSVKIALGSISHSAKLILEITGIEHLFDYLVDPDSVEHLKPAPDIFLNAMEHFHLNPKECWGIEDALVGVQSIKAAQIFCIGIGDQQVLADANIVFTNVDQLSFKTILEVYQKF